MKEVMCDLKRGLRCNDKVTPGNNGINVMTNHTVSRCLN